MSERIQNGQTETITALVISGGLPKTGLADVLLTIRRTSDDYFLDWHDNTFKNSGWTEREKIMTEIDAVTCPGQYRHDFNTSGFADNDYICTVTSANADNMPQTGEIKAGDYIDNIDAAISSRADENPPSQVLADYKATGYATENPPSQVLDDYKATGFATENPPSQNLDDYKADVSGFADNLKEVLALMGKNYRLKDVNRDGAGNMIAGTVCGYANAADAENDTNAIITIAVTGDVTSGRLTGALQREA